MKKIAVAFTFFFLWVPTFKLKLSSSRERQ